MAKLCGAKTRSGEPCRSKAMPNGRCRMHGGTNKGAPKNNQNSVKAGTLYSDYYTDAEKLLAEELELESIDAELRLCKIRLNRALKLEAEQAAEALELERIVETPAIVGGVPITDDPDVPPVQQKTFVRKDYEPIIQRLLGRIESLTLTRQKLVSGMKLDLTSSDGSMRQITRVIIDPKKNEKP